MKTPALIRFLVIVSLITLCQCNPSPEVDSPPSPNPPLEQVLATNTPTALPGVIPATQQPPDQLTGSLEIRFPDPWERPEFCSVEIPYVMNRAGSVYELSGEGVFY